MMWRMFWIWVPFELFLALNCSEQNAPFIVPVVLLIWAIETSWIWAEKPEQDQGNNTSTWAGRGRLSLLLFVLLIEDPWLNQAFGLQRESVCVIFFVLAALNQPVSSPNNLYYAEALFWTSLFVIASHNAGIAKPHLLLIPFAVVYSENMRTDYNISLSTTRQEAPSVIEKKSNKKDADVALATAVSSEVPEMVDLKKTEEEGSLLIKAMAPQIVLDILSDSEVVVSALCERNGTYRWVSRSVEKLYGYTREELIGTSGWSTVHPEDIQSLLKRNRDPSNRVRMKFRRRRKDGSYVAVETLGLFNEGFLFFQEYEKKEALPYVLPQDIDRTTATVSLLARYLFARRDAIDAKRLEELIWLHDDVVGSCEKQLRAVDVKDCLNRIVRRGVILRDERKMERKVSKFHAVAKGLLDSDESVMVASNPARLYRSIEGIIEALFEQPENTEVAFEAAMPNPQSLIFSFASSQFPRDDMRIESAKSFAVHFHKGKVNCFSEANRQRLELLLDFASDSTSATCLIVDDDVLILKVMQKRLVPIWRDLHKTELHVLTARTGQEAVQIARNNSPNRFAFVSVDLNLDTESVLSGEETVQKLKELNCADRVVVLTATPNPSMNVGEFVYVKGSPDLYRDLCRSSSISESLK